MNTNDFLKIADEASLTERNINIHSFEVVDSTNSEAKRAVMSGKAKAPALFVANTQTSGRGRMGRSFFSPANTGIYMTLALDVTEDTAADTIKLTAATAVAVSRAIKQVTNITVGIKWVNDLYFMGKKVCGILAESFSADDKRYALVGVGINLSTQDFPNEICGIAGNLVGEAGELRRELAIAVCREIYDIYRQKDRGFTDEYRSLSVVLGKRVEFFADGEKRTGYAAHIDDGGALWISTDSGESIRLCSGEISLKLSEVDK